MFIHRMIPLSRRNLQVSLTSLFTSTSCG
jgi:hypothetical protein